MRTEKIFITAYILACSVGCAVQSARDNPQATLSTSKPCISDTVTLSGSGFGNRTVHIFILPLPKGRSSTEKVPFDEKAGVTLAYVTPGLAGDLRYNFQFKHSLGTNGYGQNVTVDTSNDYIVYIKYSSFSGEAIMSAGVLSLCQE